MQVILFEKRITKVFVMLIQNWTFPNKLNKMSVDQLIRHVHKEFSALWVSKPKKVLHPTKSAYESHTKELSRI